jgi:hypothetical protein
MDMLGRSSFVVGLRFRNIFEFALGRVNPFGLAGAVDDAWDYQHITSWNFLPFQLQHAGFASAWVVQLTFAMWGVALVGLVWTLWRLRNLLATNG